MGDREERHSHVGQHFDQPADPPRDIGLHGRGDGQAVLGPQLDGVTHHLVQLFDGARLGVHVEAHGADTDMTRVCGVDHAPPVSGAPRGEPPLEWPVDLYVPTETSVVIPSAGALDQVEHRIEVLEVVGRHHVLAVCVAHVQVCVVDQGNRPFALRAQVQLSPADDGAIVSPDGEPTPLLGVHLGDEHLGDQGAALTFEADGPGLSRGALERDRQRFRRFNTAWVLSDHSHQAEPHHLLQAQRRAFEQRQVGGLQRLTGDFADLDEHRVR
jgi:hypothetical protein